MTRVTVVVPVTLELEIELAGNFLPYQPAAGPSYASGGDPPCPAEYDYEIRTIWAGGTPIKPTVTLSDMLDTSDFYERAVEAAERERA